MYSWIPHTHMVLGLFRADSPYRSVSTLYPPYPFPQLVEDPHSHAEGDLRITSVNVVDDRTIVFRIAVALEGSSEDIVDATIDAGGLVSFAFLDSASETILNRDDERYFAKEVSEFLRTNIGQDHFGITWGHDLFRVSHSDNEQNSILEILDGMISASEDRLDLLKAQVDKRLRMRYAEDAGRIASMKGDEIERIRAAKGFIAANARLERRIETQTYDLLRLLDACTNFIHIYSGSDEAYLERVSRLRTSANDISSLLHYRHSRDIEVFGMEASMASIEMQETARKQTEAMDRLTKMVTVLTLFATFATMTALFLDLLGEGSEICSVICGVAIVIATMIVFRYGGSAKRRISQWWSDRRSDRTGHKDRPGLIEIVRRPLQSPPLFP